MNMEQIADIARHKIAAQGFKASANVWERQVLIVRIQTLAGASVGSVGIMPHMTEWDEDTVNASIQSAVLDSCAFAASEPALISEMKRRA